MRAVILTAGRGNRLREVTGERPKCLAQVGGRTLLDRQLESLRGCGVTSVAVVTGYRSIDVRRACGPAIDYVHNARFADTNSLYSLWLARELLSGGFVVMNCDVMFHRQMLVDLITSPYEDALLLSPACDAEPYSDEEMKVRVRGGRVVEISKTMKPEDADGENVGIAKFGADGAAVLIDEMNAAVKSGAITEWLPAAFGRFSRRRTLHAIDHRGYPWIEIDSPQDYWRACTQVAPALEAPARPARRSGRHV
ncbi:MAG TPA: phosphocholine cytidylyltransferase family protein [Vicinamibacterales bacterium]|nr:phosphocholine cytidylyltransferase family protein [Vicinamibacterales bacterium]